MEEKKKCLYKKYCYWHKIERALISLQVETSRLIVGSCRVKNAIPFKNMSFAFLHIHKFLCATLPQNRSF